MRMDYTGMKMKKLFVIVCLTSLFSASLSKAGCPEDCRSALSAADKVIADQAKEIGLYKTESELLTQEIIRLSVSLNDKNQALSAWYHNPFIVGAIGIVLGGGTILYLKK